MRIEEIGLTVKGLEEREDGDICIIKIHGEKVFEVFDGEPEDNALSRNFNDCYKIIDLMQMTYESGKRGEELTFETVQVDEA